MTDLDRGAIAALQLLTRSVVVTEGETEPEQLADDIESAIRKGGLANAVRLQMNHERTLNIRGEFSVTETYGRFPRSLARLAGNK